MEEKFKQKGWKLVTKTPTDPKLKPVNHWQQSKINPITSRNHDIKCFKCLGKGHIISQCPNKSVMIKQKNGDIQTKNDSDTDSIPPLEKAHEEEHIV